MDHLCKLEAYVDWHIVLNFFGKTNCEKIEQTSNFVYIQKKLKVRAQNGMSDKVSVFIYIFALIQWRVWTCYENGQFIVPELRENSPQCNAF